jgi:hypothetical protein
MDTTLEKDIIAEAILEEATQLEAVLVEGNPM